VARPDWPRPHLAAGASQAIVLPLQAGSIDTPSRFVCSVNFLSYLLLPRAPIGMIIGDDDKYWPAATTDALSAIQ
jgi:hypothetical protein